MIRKKLISVSVVFALLIGTMFCCFITAAAETDNLFTGGEWVKGQYLSSGWKDFAGTLDTINRDVNSKYRIAYNKKIDVTPLETYLFNVNCSVGTIKFVVRGYDSSGALVTVTPATIISGKITMPDNVVQIGVSIYDTRMTSGPTAETLLSMMSKGTLNPVVTLKSTTAAVTMADGAAMRIDGDTDGIRFTATVPTADLVALKDSGAEITDFGMLIAPALNNPTTDNMTVGTSVESTADSVASAATVVAAKYGNVTPTADETSGLTVIVGSLVEIKPDNANKQYVARAYVEYKDTNGSKAYIYSDISEPRSIAQVAKAIVDANDSYYTSLCKDHKDVVDNWANQYSE